MNRRQMFRALLGGAVAAPAVAKAASPEAVPLDDVRVTKCVELDDEITGTTPWKDALYVTTRHGIYRVVGRY